MSCCDNSELKIQNQCPDTIWEIKSVNVVEGKWSNPSEEIKPGELIKNGVTIKGSMSSDHGSRGNASVDITIQETSTSELITLSFQFDSSGGISGGKCPCTPVGANSPITGNSCTFTALPVTGQTEGTATLTWDITPIIP